MIDAFLKKIYISKNEKTNLSTAPTEVFWHRGIDDRRIINPKFFLEEHEWDQGHKETIYIKLIHDLF